MIIDIRQGFFASQYGITERPGSWKEDRRLAGFFGVQSYG
jgi:hypothetical protein